MIRFIKVSIAFTLLVSLGQILNAQQNVNQEVRVVKPYEPNINDAFRISELPKIVDTSRVISKFDYEIIPKKQETGFTPKPISSARLISEPLTKLYYGHAKAGFGTYLTPLAQVYLGSQRSEQLNWNVMLHHNSMHGKLKNEESEKVYAGYSDTRGDAQVKYFTKNNKVFTFGTNLSNNINYYYGYNPAIIAETNPAPLLKDSIENQSINFFKANGNYKSNYLDSANVNYNLDLGWQTLSGKEGVSENALKINANIDHFFEKEFLGVDLALKYYTQTGIQDSLNGAIVKFSPWIGAFGDKWRTVVGVSTYYDQAYQKYYFYPKVSMHYNVIDYFLIPYFELDGIYNENSYKEIYDKNPFITQNLGVKPTNTKINATFGLRGNISSKVAFNLKVNYAAISNQYFFVNDTSSFVPLQNKFNVVYDDITRIRFLAEISYKTGENLFLTLKGNYFEYQLENEAQAWHMPEYTLSLNARYLIQKKIVIDANLFAIGDRFAREFDADGVQNEKTLQGVVDLNLGVEYHVSKVFSAFAQFNNLSSVKNYEWNHYPSQRFNAMLGVSYSF